MAWLTEENFRDIYVTESASEVTSEQISECLDSAVSQIIKKTAIEVIADFLLTSPTLPLQANDLRRAQGKLAYAELLFIQSARYRSGGILSTERDENSQSTNTYESFTQMEKRADRLRSDAFEILEPYLIAEEQTVSSVRLLRC